MLQVSVDYLVFKLLGLDPNNQWAASLNFFIYDSIKIILLLFLMIFAIGTLRTYIPQEKMKKWIGKTRFGFGNFFASIFGAITPFCSCSSIPIFISFLEAGIPLGVAFSFLITSPLVNEYLVVLMLSLFGWKITLAYVISGILVGVIAGFILGKLGLEHHLVKDLITKRKKTSKQEKYNSFKERLLFGIDEATLIVKKMWIWVLVGVGLGAAIHNLIPSSSIQELVNVGGWFTVPAVTLLGIPLYANCAAILPVAAVLFQKGIPLGTALSFMMATSALSLPEAIILRRAMKLKLILIFFGIVAISIILTGYLFNLLQVWLV